MKNEAFTEQAERVMGPMREINAAAVDKTEKLVKLQVSAFENYSKLALDHWREALQVKDVDGMKDFLAKHRAYVETLTDKAAKDASAVMELGNDYVAEVQTIFKTSTARATGQKAA